VVTLHITEKLYPNENDTSPEDYGFVWQHIFLKKVLVLVLKLCQHCTDADVLL